VEPTSLGPAVAGTFSDPYKAAVTPLLPTRPYFRSIPTDLGTTLELVPNA